MLAVEVPLEDGGVSVAGTLRLRCRPGREQLQGAPLLLRLDAGDAAMGRETISVLEDCEYLYEVELTPEVQAASIRIEPVELFDADDESGFVGRLRPGLSTGALKVAVMDGSRSVGRCDLEVRSRKLGYLDDYRSMLSSIARDGAELLLQRFAPSSVAWLEPDLQADARTLYQRFAFLRAVLEDPQFDSAVATIVARPHVDFDRIDERRPVGRGAPCGSDLVRQLTRPGPRGLARGSAGPLATLPESLSVSRFSGNYDTEPNRFVRMAFETWRASCIALRDALTGQQSSGPVERGGREVSGVIDRLDMVLSLPALREAGRLSTFPAANQVLQKRAGYRDVMRAYVQSEAAARLRWDGEGEDVFQGGQRNVATLYEYWCYLQLARIIEDICDLGFDRAELFELSADGTTLGLRRGRQRVLRGGVRRNGRRLELELWFNKTFNQESWSRAMRPDCSLLINLDYPLGQYADSIWLHFDAKYRVEHAMEVLEGDDESIEEIALSSKRSDLLKMHAYRDAIRRSAGAYVLYPGADEDGELRTAYREIVPGIGAFPFRVGLDGDADGMSVAVLRQFLEDVMDHTSNQATSYERARFWTERSYRDLPPFTAARPGLERPPADTLVLLGFVRDEAHLSWILEHHLYNLRADQRTGSIGRNPSLLAADRVLLYGPPIDGTLVFRRVGPPTIHTRDDMVDLAYPNPRGELYCCMVIERLEVHSIAISSDQIREIRRRAHPGARIGEPAIVTWAAIG